MSSISHETRFNYDHVPTIRQFAHSNAFVRGIVGPFGCLPAGTEFMSRGGWKRMDEWESGDEVLQWNRDGSTDFVVPLAYISRPFDGEFVRFESGTLTMELTPDHSVPHYDWSGRFAVCSAGQIEAVPSRRKIPTTFQAPETDGLGMNENLIRFAVMMHADGHYPPSGRNAVVTVREQRKKQRVRALLRALDVEFDERVYPGRPTESIFVFEPPYRGKRFDGVWWKASGAEMAVVLDELSYWDGLYGSPETRYFTAEKADADYIQYAAHACGRRATIATQEYPHNPEWRPTHIVQIKQPESSKNCATIREITHTSRVRNGDGKQYCFTVPSGFFVARCEDSVFVTGNSGKSTGCVVEIIRRGREQRPAPDGVRRTRWAVIRNCFDDRTEILTEARGWQLFRNLLPEDRVATLEGGTRLVFERPSHYYAAHYRGEMIGMASDGIDMMVTPTHRLYTSRRRTRKKTWGCYEFEHANSAYGRTLRRFKRDAEWDGGAARYSEDFYELLGFWFADGYAGAYKYPDRNEPPWRFVIVQKAVAYARDLMRRSEVGWSESFNRESGCTYFRVRVTSAMKPLVAELAALGRAHEKYLPLWLKDAPSAHAAAFLKGYMRGDGTARRRRHQALCARTSSKRLADDVQELALRAGFVVNVGRRRFTQREGAFRGSVPETWDITFLQPSRHEPMARGWFKQDYDAMVYCVEVPSHVVYVRRGGKAHWSGQTFSELNDTTIKTFFQWFPPHYYGRYHTTEKRYTINALEGCQIEVLFRPLDDPEDVKKLLSLDLTGAWINEAREVPWPVVDAVQGRLGRYPPQNMGGPSWSGLIMDTNPPDSDSRFYRFFEEEEWRPSFEAMKREGALPRDAKPEDFAQIFHQPSGLSPEAENLANLQPGYYQRLAIGKSAEWVKVYIHGQYGFVSDDKTIFPEFNERVHVRALEPIEGRPVVRSWDFGLTPACVLSQELDDGRWLVFDEMISESMGIDRFSDEVLEHCSQTFRGRAVFNDYGDPAGQQRAQTDERTCFEILQAKGIMIEPGLQTLAIRLESVRKPLRTLINGEPQFALHPRCRALRKAFLGGYHYRRLSTNAERYSNLPEKNASSHPMDALQYAATILFGGGLTAERGPRDDYPSALRSDVGRSKVTGY